MATRTTSRIWISAAAAGALTLSAAAPAAAAGSAEQEDHLETSLSATLDSQELTFEWEGDAESYDWGISYVGTDAVLADGDTRDSEVTVDLEELAKGDYFGQADQSFYFSGPDGEVESVQFFVYEDSDGQLSVGPPESGTEEQVELYEEVFTVVQPFEPVF